MPRKEDDNDEETFLFFFVCTLCFVFRRENEDVGLLNEEEDTFVFERNKSILSPSSISCLCKSPFNRKTEYNTFLIFKNRCKSTYSVVSKMDSTYVPLIRPTCQ